MYSRKFTLKFVRVTFRLNSRMILCVLSKIAEHVIATITHGIATIKHVIETIKHVIETIKHKIATITHGIATIKHVIETIKHVIATITHVIETIMYCKNFKICIVINMQLYLLRMNQPYTFYSCVATSSFHTIISLYMK